MGVMSLLVSLAGCGAEEQKREYAIPDSVCGISVDPDSFSPLFPPGKKVDVQSQIYETSQVCDVVVDKTTIATMTQAWLPKGATTTYFAAYISLDPPRRSVGAGLYRYSGREAFGKTEKCVDVRHGQELYTATQVWSKGYNDADAMRRLIVSYTRRVENAEYCTTGVRD
jgi:hypothetical protein